MALRSLFARKALSGSLGFRQLPGLETLTRPDLPSGYGVLEPAISGEIMQIHPQKHHRIYVTNYNKTLEQLDDAVNKGDAPTVNKSQSAIKFNGGGHINHSIFWKNLPPISQGGSEPPKMNAEGAALHGYGWVWLGVDKELNRRVIETTTNQDPLVTKAPNLVPLLGQHASYLQYKNVRLDYLKHTWKVMNRKYASEAYEKESGALD